MLRIVAGHTTGSVASGTDAKYWLSCPPARILGPDELKGKQVVPLSHWLALKRAEHLSFNGEAESLVPLLKLEKPAGAPQPWR
jgi:hypothetical protein